MDRSHPVTASESTAAATAARRTAVRPRKLAALAPGSVDLGPHESSPLPVIGLAVDYPRGMDVPAHSHAHSQLLYAVQGVLEVRTATGRWLVPPSKAVWLAPGVAHSIHMPAGRGAAGAVRVRSLLIDTRKLGLRQRQGLPPKDCVIEVSSLLRALISEVAHWPVDAPRGRREHLLVQLLIEELSLPAEMPLHLPWPDAPRFHALCERLLAEPGDARTAEDCAAGLAMSAKTFHRHFEKSTGLSFGRWRQRARLLGSLPALLAGAPVMQVALDAGYESHSAYSLAFKAQMGVSPSRFAAQARAQGAS